MNWQVMIIKSAQGKGQEKLPDSIAERKKTL